MDIVTAKIKFYRMSHSALVYQTFLWTNHSEQRLLTFYSTSTPAQLSQTSVTSVKSSELKHAKLLFIAHTLEE
jgi:hypothetical protein